jgi:hypothetical protein
MRARVIVFVTEYVEVASFYSNTSSLSALRLIYLLQRKYEKVKRDIATLIDFCLYEDVIGLLTRT